MKAMRVDPEQLADVAASIGRCAEDLGTSLDSLQSTVTTDNPWGADGPGTLFGLAYVEVLNHAMDVYGSHVEQLMEAAQGLAAWATSVGHVDQHHAGEMARLDARLGG